MTRRPQLDERDPVEPATWVEHSSPGIRRHTLDITRAAVRASKEKGKRQ